MLETGRVMICVGFRRTSRAAAGRELEGVVVIWVRDKVRQCFCRAVLVLAVRVDVRAHFLHSFDPIS